jgi:hypothetical protein
MAARKVLGNGSDYLFTLKAKLLNHLGPALGLVFGAFYAF